MTEITLDINPSTFAEDLVSQVKSTMPEEQALLLIYQLIDRLSLELGEIASGFKQDLGKKFAPFIRGLGIPLPVVNQLTKVFEVAEQLQPPVVEELDVYTLKKLAQPKNAKALDAIAQLEECDVELAEDLIKEHRLPLQPKNPWKYVGAANTADGLPREYELPRVSETMGILIESKKQQDGVSSRQIVEQALNKYFELFPIQKLTPSSVQDVLLEDKEFQIVQSEFTAYLEEQIEQIAPEVKEWDSFIYRGSEYSKYQDEKVVIREVLKNGRVKVGVIGRSFKFECSIADLMRCG